MNETNDKNVSTCKQTKCVCGNVFKPMKATEIYRRGAECDVCHRYSQQDDIFWHCLGEKNSTHLFGRDICGMCIDYYHQNVNEQIKKDCNDVNCFDSDISCCEQWKQLKCVMETFNNGNYAKCLMQMNISQINNIYLHLIENHNAPDQFQFVTKQLRHCNMFTCASLRRHYRDRNNEFGEKNSGITTELQILDKIHCYYYHINIERYEFNSSKSEQKSNNYDSNIKQTISQRATKKYNQLIETQDMYRAGYKFIYGYSGETTDADDQAISVSSKYSSFKQELLSNSISTISIKQFSSEYQKAIIYLSSLHCKRVFVPKMLKGEPWYFLIQHLLSLMIYCNFTDLQYEFTKTYRQDQGISHDNFYFFGMYLKIAVQVFGTEIRHSRIQRFYHGIGEKLLFSLHKYREDSVTCHSGVLIYGPVSTTSSLQVAQMFTKSNNGLIVEFGGDYFSYSTNKYFAVSWLSDYSHEQEYLFVQNVEHFPIVNIYDPQFGYEYGAILMALETLQHIISNLYRYVLHRVPSKTVKLIQNILNNQLSPIFWYSSLDKYGKKIITTFLQNQTEIDLNLVSFKKMNLADPLTGAAVLKLLYDFENEWINMCEIQTMFQNMTRLKIIDMRISSATMDSIFNHLKTNTVSKLQKITIIQAGESNVLSLISNYQHKFKEINHSMKISDDANDITITKMQYVKD